MKTLKTIGYWFVHCTWGILPTILGFFCFLFTRRSVKKTTTYKGMIVSYIGHNWGGFNLGPFAFIYIEAEDRWTENRRITEHEWGHSIQGLVFGSFQLFVVDIPSAARYWYREYLRKHDYEKYKAQPDYDAIWFEGSATKIGAKYRESDEYWKNK